MSSFPMNLPGPGYLGASNAQAIQNYIQQMGLGFTGKVYYLDPANGDNHNNGISPDQAVQTLAQGYALLRSGYNDVLVLVSNGATTSSARLSAGFTWAKSAAHLVGVSSGVNISNRSRIAPTAAVTAFANFFTVSGSGCLFSNIQWFQGFDTGVAAEICLTVTGGRNLFVNCHIAGMGDTVSATDTGSRNLKITGTGENQFVNCVIGIDTVARTVANASLEFASGTPRNEFRNCQFPIFATGAGALIGITAGAAAMDRFQLFDRCTFLNSIKSGAGTAITGAFTLAASSGGLLMFRDLAMVGVTSLGSDATSKAQMYEFGPANSTSTGIGANPA
jgi:hypothetical protein